MPNVYPTNIIGGLPELRWRTLRAPCSEISCDFSHTQAPIEYPYIDDAGHDNTGRSAYKITATLCFLNTLEDGLYPAGWRLWMDALLDGSSDDFVHPDIGQIRARVLDASFAITARERAGITVRVTWTSTIDDIDQPNTVTGADVSLSALAEEVDGAMLLLGLTYPDGGDGSTSIGEALGSVTGTIQSTATSVSGKLNSAIGTIDKVSGQLDQLHDSAERLHTNTAWTLKSNIETISASLAETKKRLQAGARPTAERVTDSDTTLDAFARLMGNKVSEIIQLNLSALGQPSVPKGTTLVYYKAA